MEESLLINNRSLLRCRNHRKRHLWQETFLCSACYYSITLLFKPIIYNLTKKVTLQLNARSERTSFDRKKNKIVNGSNYYRYVLLVLNNTKKITPWINKVLLGYVYYYELCLQIPSYLVQLSYPINFVLVYDAS